MQNIELTAKEVLLELIQAERKKYPVALKVPDVMKLLDTSDVTIYKKLRNGEIPGGKNISGIGWRINRDVFLTWLYSKEIKK